MKVIAFLGSPRKGGNTELLTDEACRGTGRDVVPFRLDRMDISPCRNCGGCNETGVCVVDDEMQEIHRAIREAHRIILSSPVFFMGVSAQAKAMIDRCQALWCEKYLLERPIPQGEDGRKGLLLLVGGMRKGGGIECCERTATAFFRSISVPGHRSLSYTGVDASGDIRRHPSALNEALEAGRELVSRD